MKKRSLQIGINEIVEVTFGTMLNKPSISFFSGICDDINAIKQGDLFVAKNTEDAHEAIIKGAFGILFSGEIAINDKEVAWISVDNLDQALFKILRHFLIVGNKKLFLLSKEEFEILFQILLPKNNVLCVNDNIVGLIHKVIDLENPYIFYHNESFVLREDWDLSGEISFLSNEKIPDDKIPFTLNSFSLFSMRIFYKSMDYTISLPKIFLQLLARILKLVEEYSFAIDLENLSGLSCFKPLYLDIRGFTSKLGATNRVLISTENNRLYEQYLAYFLMYAKYAKLKLFVPKIYAELFAPYADVVIYENREELFASLLDGKYNFALILGEKIEVFEERFKKQEIEQSLFDFAEE